MANLLGVQCRGSNYIANIHGGAQHHPLTIDQLDLHEPAHMDWNTHTYRQVAIAFSRVLVERVELQQSGDVDNNDSPLRCRSASPDSSQKANLLFCEY